MQQFLKAAARTARARVVSAQLLDELFITVNYPRPALNLGL
jgi:hypothetical protein